MDAYEKTPAEIAHVVVDMRDFVAEVDPQVVTFTLRAELGIAIDDVTTTVGLIELDVSGGKTGRVYVIGVEAKTGDGQSETVTKRIRLIEPPLWPDLPGGVPVGGVGAGSSSYADNYSDNYA
jgi:hypothetical protein